MQATIIRSFSLLMLFACFLNQAHAQQVDSGSEAPALLTTNTYLTDKVLTQNKASFVDLYKQWLVPLMPGRSPELKREELSVAAIKDGFQRWCNLRGAESFDLKTIYGNTYTCKETNGALFAELRVERWEGEMLRVGYDTPETIALKEKRKADFEALKTTNGPTGWINTSEGRFKFLRIGLPDRRYVISVNEYDQPRVPIEQVSRIDFKDPCCDMVVTKRDGSSRTMNDIALSRMLSVNSHTDFGVYCNSGLPFVVDTNDFGPQVQIFSNLKGLKSIEIDPDESNWKKVPSGPMSVPFDEKNCEVNVVGGPKRPSLRQAAPKDETMSGTGIFVSTQGHLLTNDHVVGSCKSLWVRTIGGADVPAMLVGRDKTNDLALLKTQRPVKNIASFRKQPAVIGEKAYAFGFPLTGLLSSEGNASEGLVSALAGIEEDSRLLQMSTPVQPGNSGGPLYDSRGAVIGIVVSKLNALALMRATGDIAQNVNFAIKESVAEGFMVTFGIGVRSSIPTKPQDPVAIFSKARNETAFVHCAH